MATFAHSPRHPERNLQARSRSHTLETSVIEAALRETVALCAARWGVLFVGQPGRPEVACACSLPPELSTRLDAFIGLWWASLSASAPARPEHLLVPVDLPPAPAGSSTIGVRLPIVAPSATAWALVVGYSDDPTPTAHQRALLTALADRLRLSIEQAALQHHSHRLISQLALINQLSQRITSIQDRQQLFQQITWVICDSLGYDHVQLLLIDETHQLVELVHAGGPAGRHLLDQGFSERIGGKGIIGWVAGSGTIWVCNDVRSDPLYAFHRLLPNTASELALPLRVGQRIIGVLDVQSERLNAFDDDTVLLLQTVADQIAPALEYARLLAAERSERELATTLRDVSRIICSSLDLEQVLSLILQQIGRVVPHIGARVSMRDGDVMRVVAARGTRPSSAEALKGAYRIDEAPLAQLFIHEQRTLIIADAEAEPRWHWLPGSEGVRSWCCAPLVIKGRAVGALSVDWGEPGFYTEEHARIVRALADQAAVAVENALLHARQKSFNERLEAEVQQRTAELRQARDEIAAQAAQLRALVHRVVKVQEAERQRIAHDLHDSITQSILAAVYELQALKPHIAAPERIEACQRLLASTLDEMRLVIYALRPRALDELGLLAALENFAAQTRRYHAVPVTFSVYGPPHPLPEDVELMIYRVVQEATQNSIRHAAATTITISVSFEPEQVRVTINDDGHGFDSSRIVAGLGLAGMRERAQALGGAIEIASSPGCGTSVTLMLPQSNTRERTTDACADR